MGNEILHDVIAAEAEIQRNIGMERKKARELIETVRMDAEEKIIREEERLKESGAQAVKEAAAEAEKRAGSIIDKAVARADILEKIESDSIRDIILKHIIRILPGGIL